MAISLAHKSITIDVNDRNAPNVVGIVNVNDKATRYLDVTLTANGEKLTFADCTVTATFATDGYLISDSVACTLNSTADVITVPLEDFKSMSGFLAIEIKIANGETQVLNTPLALKVKVTPSLLDKSMISKDSVGTAAEICREVATARGKSSSLNARLNGIDSSVSNKADQSTVSQLSAQMQTAEKALTGKANATDVANALKSKEDNLNKVSSKTDITDSSTNYPSIEYLNEYYYNTNETYSSAETDEFLGNKADVNSVYSKVETDNLLGNKADKVDASKLKDDLAEFYKPVSDLDNKKDVDLFISDSYGNILATFKDGEFITKEFSTVNSIGNNICDTLEECDLAISDVQGNVVFCIVDDNIITPKYNAKNHYKTFSILGDSYSTFKDYTDPLNNTQWYPPSDSATQGSENDVEDVENTWWHLFANDYKSLLIQNNSYSGSCISYDSYGTGTVDGKNFSFVKRCENLKKAELIIIEGGTNDAWSNVPLGEYKYSNWVESDFETFRPACSYVLDYIKRNNIGAKIIFVLNNGLKSSITESIKNICNYYNVDVLELSNIKKNNNHPNIEGMKQIKEQLINFLTRSDFNG